MWQNLHDLVAVESAVPFRHNSPNGKRFTPRLFFGDCAREFSVCGVAWFHGDEMAANATTDQREVADNVEDLVSDEFILKTQWLFAQNGIAAHNDRVFQAAALDQILFH